MEGAFNAKLMALIDSSYECPTLCWVDGFDNERVFPIHGWVKVTIDEPSAMHNAGSFHCKAKTFRDFWNETFKDRGYVSLMNGELTVEYTADPYRYIFTITQA